MADKAAGNRLDQRALLRDEAALDGATVVVRGGTDTRDKLRRHVARTARAWSLDGQPLLGISVFAVLDMPLEDLLRKRFTNFRTIYLPSVAGVLKYGFELLATGQRPHFTIRLHQVSDERLGRLLARSVTSSRTPSTLERESLMRSSEMYRVDITADLNDEDHTGYLWTFLDEARDPGRIRPGAVVIAGDEDTAAVCQVVDLVPAGDGTIVHLKPLPGLVEDYQASAGRPIAS